MGYVQSIWDSSKGKFVMCLKPYGTDLKCFRVVKSRTQRNCSNCGKTIPSKSYVFSSDWIGFCLKCGEEFSKEALKEYAKISKYIKDNQKKLKKNKDKWEAENSLALL